MPLPSPTTPDPVLLSQPTPNTHSPSIRSRSPLRGRSSRSPARSLPPVLIDYSNLLHDFVSGKRVGSNLLRTIDENQIYRFKVKHKNVAQYDCYKNKEGCRAKVYLNLTSKVCYRKSECSAHNHGENDDIKKMLLVDTIKRRCRSATTSIVTAQSVRQVYNETVRRYSLILLNSIIFV